MKMQRRDFLKASVAAGACGLISQAGATTLGGDLVTKPIPKTGEQIPVIGIGTNRYSVGTSESERAPLRQVLTAFADAGGTLIDTAPMYRKSQAVLGELLAETGLTDKFFMATKCDTSGGDRTRAQMEESRTLLGYETIDLMQVHSLRNWGKQLPVVREWKEAGKVRYLGITTSRGSQHDDLVGIMKKEPLDFVQINYSMIDREAEDELLPLALEQGVAVLVNLPFARGDLFSKTKGVDLPEWAAEFDCHSWGQFFLKYVVSHPAVTCAIPGTTKLHHAQDNIGAAMGVLPGADQRKQQQEFFASL